MKKINKIKRIIGIIILLLIVIIGVYAVLIVIPNTKSDVIEQEKIKFDYVLYDRDKNVYKEIFNELKKELNKDEFDYEKYATYISELFVIDLYTLNNKLSKDDIGGVQFVKDEIKENFKLNASRTMYKYINSDNKSKLPEVSSVNVVEVKKSTYNIDSKEYESYEVSLTWEYKEDLGYDKEGTVYVIKDKDELFVVEKK